MTAQMPKGGGCSEKRRWYRRRGGRRSCVASSSAASFATAGGSSAAARRRSRCSCKWVAQAQFAGYYAAKAKGFYKQAGLDVTIKPGGPDIIPEQVVLGEAGRVRHQLAPEPARHSATRATTSSTSPRSTHAAARPR